MFRPLPISASLIILVYLLLVAFVWGGYDKITVSKREDVINFSADDKCVPEVSCKGIDITTIPYITGFTQIWHIFFRSP